MRQARSRLRIGPLVGLALVAGALLALQSAAAHNHLLPAPGKHLTIQQFDVGQGDAALITTPEGKRILIDAGPDARQVADLLSIEKIDTLHLVIASHNHADHIGGMPEVLSRFVVNAYLDNGVLHTTGIYRRTLSAVVREPNLQYLNATARTITLGSVALRILPPPHVNKSQNNNSVGVVVGYGRFRALFTGDSERTELRSWLRDGFGSRVTYLKAAHHGSANGTTAEWARITSPEIVAVSAGAGNRYRHPSARSLSIWRAAGAQIFRTDEDGTIRVTADAEATVSVQVGESYKREDGQ